MSEREQEHEMVMEDELEFEAESEAKLETEECPHHDLRRSLAERIEEETDVDLDPEEHIDIDRGDNGDYRATLTESGAEALSARKPGGSTAENRVPDWLAVGPYTARAIAFFAGALVLVGFSVQATLATGGIFRPAAFAIGAVLCALLGDYYRTAIHA